MVNYSAILSIFMNNTLRCHSPVPLALIVQFIEAFANKVGCDITEFSVFFENEEFHDYSGKLCSDNYRRIADSFQSDEEVKKMIKDILTSSNWDYDIDT